MSETRTFLLEIGTEEIPASYLEPAAEALALGLKSTLEREGIVAESVKALWSPRRIALLAELPTASLEKSEERQGPPAKIAKDANGSWTVAAKKFAQGLGVDESTLFIKESGKTSYVCARRTIGREQTVNILQRILPDILKRIPFPKNMRWPLAGEVTFARPVRWLCALFGNEIVKFEFAGLESSNVTRGHRFAHPETITLDHTGEYVEKLRASYVLVDREERKACVIKELSSKAKELGGELVPNDELIEEVTDLIEFPKVIDCHLGAFTDLPREVLETALAKHQRAFVIEKKTKLLPYFLVVTNAPMLDPELARPWFQRMSLSRLEDAEFFIKEDLAKGLEALVREESRVEWIKGIGLLAQKTSWLSELGKSIGKGIPGFDLSAYERAAYLAKADLLTNLVREKEFTSLQGIAGGIYAVRLGETEQVSTIIREQYTDTPSSPESSVLAISDRLLNIAATFALGKPPRGSSDPFALRRQATAIHKILIDRRQPVELNFAIEKTLHLIGKGSDRKSEIEVFLEERLRLLLVSQGFPYDWVDAVLTVKSENPYMAWQRLGAFRELNKGEEFKRVAVGQKRVANILRDSSEIFTFPPEPDSQLLSEEAEKKLWDASELAYVSLQDAVDKRDNKRALEVLLSLRPHIDRFFDEVFVMVDDPQIRDNRLRLLRYIRSLFLLIADFSKIVVESNNP